DQSSVGLTPGTDRRHTRELRGEPPDQEVDLSLATAPAALRGDVQDPWGVGLLHAMRQVVPFGPVQAGRLRRAKLGSRPEPRLNAPRCLTALCFGGRLSSAAASC